MTKKRKGSPQTLSPARLRGSVHVSDTTTDIPSPVAVMPLDTSWVDRMDEESTGVADTPDIVDTPDTPDTPDTVDTPDIVFSSSTPTDADLDRLWDWVRADDDQGYEFFGFTPETSQRLRQHFLAIHSNPNAVALAIMTNDTHAGFVVFNPIDRTSMTAVVHLYLAPAVRGQALTVVPQLLRLCGDQYPLLSLVVITGSESRMRLYRQLDFEVRYLLTRKAHHG
jgi:hypothetical protein